MPHFFDLDATLLDHEHSVSVGLESLTANSAELRAAADEQLFVRWISAEQTHYVRYERREIAFQEHRRERLRECFPEICAGRSDRELDSMYHHYLEGYQRGWRLYPEAEAVLEELRREPMALITNGESSVQRAKVVRLGLEPYFSGIFVSGELGFTKPDPRIFQAACEALGVAPERVHFVGNDMEKDVVGSWKAGLKPVWFNRDRLPRPAKPFEFREIATLDELLP